jgi:hypothetical protein
METLENPYALARGAGTLYIRGALIGVPVALIAWNYGNSMFGSHIGSHTGSKHGWTFGFPLFLAVACSFWLNTVSAIVTEPYLVRLNFSPSHQFIDNSIG